MDPQFFFWATLCGTLAAVVIFNRSWLSGVKRNVLSHPFEVFTYIYFVAVPAVNVIYDDYVNRALFYSDPVEALGYLNLLNAAGLLAAAVAARWGKPSSGTEAREWPRIEHMQALLAGALVTSLVLGVYNNFIALNLRASSDAAIESGIGLYALIESAPTLLAWLIVVSVWKQGRQPSTGAAVMLLALFLFVAVGMNFSRGSRVTVLLIVILGFQLFQQHVYRLSKLKVLALVLVGALVFNLMTIYKHSGLEGVSSYLAGEGVATYVDERYTNPVRIIIGDIGRADLQAAILEADREDQLPRAYGRTYVKALTLPLPDALDPLPYDWNKTVVGALAQFEIDPGAVLTADNEAGIASSRIYGLVGEALLNFGIVGAIVAFVLLGLVARWSILYANGPGGWERALIAPVVSVLPILVLFYDLDNIIFRLIMILALPGLLLLLNRALQDREAGEQPATVR
jgi:hypothetical protein